MLPITSVWHVFITQSVQVEEFSRRNFFLQCILRIVILSLANSQNETLNRGQECVTELRPAFSFSLGVLCSFLIFLMKLIHLAIMSCLISIDSGSLKSILKPQVSRIYLHIWTIGSIFLFLYTLFINLHTQSVK